MVSSLYFFPFHSFTTSQKLQLKQVESFCIQMLMKFNRSVFDLLVCLEVFCLIGKKESVNALSIMIFFLFGCFYFPKLCYVTKNIHV